MRFNRLNFEMHAKVINLSDGVINRMATNFKIMALTFELIPAALEETLERLDAIEKLLTEKSKPESVKSGYITRQDVCDLLNISLPTVHTWIKQGKLKAYHIGGRTLFKEDEVLNAAKPVNYSLK